MIRQAISCDICGTEKKLTNHWFVAYEASGELRVSGWSSRNRLRPGMKHLCGQTCLHKLVDDFMARTLTTRVPQSTQDEDEIMEQAVAADTSLTSSAAYREMESSARLITQPAAPLPAAIPARTPIRTQPELVAISGRLPGEDAMAVRGESLHITPRSRRIEAWDREREREMRAMGHRPENTIRRRSGA